MEKRVRNKRAQTHTLKLALLVFVFIAALVLFYNIVRPYLISEREDPWGESRGELATVRSNSDSNPKVIESNQSCVDVGSAGECDDRNECTSDICGKKKLCEYAVREDGSVCNFADEEGICKSGECVFD